MFWDFITLRPETTHQVCFLFSDRGIPDGYQNMNGYGSHTFKLVNDKGEAVYCKFHVKVWGNLNMEVKKNKQMTVKYVDIHTILFLDTMMVYRVKN